MSTPDKYALCRAFTKMHEGGFVDDPQDPGAATNCGITQKTLANFRGRPVTVEDVRNLQSAEIDAIYKRNYYDPAMCESLPVVLAVVVFDGAINSGIMRSVTFLQDALGVQPDGRIGPATIAAANQCNPLFIAKAALAWRLKFMQSLPTWSHFGHGWENRINDLGVYCERL